MEHKKRISLESVGMGWSASLTGMGTKEDSLPRLTPEGAISLDEPVYDCIVYLIYCPEHEKIAITNVDKTRCIWLPFVMLADNMTWDRASRDGVTILIGRDDAEMEAEEAEKMQPDYAMSYLHIQRIELAHKTCLRLTQFIHLRKNPYFQCCQDSIKVNWVASSDIFNNKLHKVWGPELKILSSMLLSNKPHIINEYTLSNALFYLYADKTEEQKLMQDMKMTDKKVRDIFNDYVEHCYPSFYMCFESFRAYFIRRGHAKEDKKLGALFRAFHSNHDRSYLDFHELLVGMLAMEPFCPASQFIRLKLIARYADREGKGFLTLSNLLYILKANDSSLSEDQAIALMESIFHKESIMANKAEHLTFIHKVQASKHELENVCRSPSSIVSQILKVERSSKTRLSDLGRQLGSTRENKDRCNFCKTQQYEYANHMVTYDTIGRSVEPKIISQQWCDPDEIMDSKEMNRARYSLEYAFSISSVPNIFLDLVRDFHFHKTSHMPGLMSQPEDRSTFAKYLRILCTELASLLQPQLKLFKINAPCVVVGDIQGSLTDLMKMEKLFFQGFPVIPENLVFLGNYSGEYSNGVECLIYLFSLKMSSPNKVFLLRGTRELGDEHSMVLKKECTEKYGDAIGKDIYGLLYNIFSLLPAAVIVDESILCVHSGIPKIGNLETMYKMSKEIGTPKSEAPMMYDLITRYPNTPDNRAPGRNDSKSHASLSGSEDRSDYHLGSDCKSDTRHPGRTKSNCMIAHKSKAHTSLSCAKSNRALKWQASATGAVELNKSNPSLKPTRSANHLELTKSNSSLKPTRSANHLELAKSNPSLKPTRSANHLELTKSNPWLKSSTSTGYAEASKSSTLLKSSVTTVLAEPCKSNTSLKSSLSTAPIPSAVSCMKSLKSYESLSEYSDLPPFKSMKSGKKIIAKLKFGKTYKKIHCKKVKSTESNKSQASALKSVKSVKSIKSMRAKSRKSISNKFKFKKHKLKVMFLQNSKSALKVPSKKTSIKTPSSHGGGCKLDLTIDKRLKTYDKSEFHDFLTSHDLTYLLRSHSICPQGYKLNFDGKCLTIFSCPNLNKCNNGAAVALIDSSNATIRFVRFDGHHNQTETNR